MCAVRCLRRHQQSWVIAGANDISASWRCLVLVLYKDITPWKASGSSAGGE